MESFADAESPEQCIEHVLGPRPAGERIKRAHSAAQMFCDNQEVALAHCGIKRGVDLAQHLALSTVECYFALAGQQRASMGTNRLEQNADPLAADRRQYHIGSINLCVPLRAVAPVGLSGNANRRAMRGRLIFPKPYDNVGSGSRSACPIDADRLYRISALVAQSRSIGEAISDAVNRDGHFNDVARRPRGRRGDRRLALDDSIEQS